MVQRGPTCHVSRGTIQLPTPRRIRSRCAFVFDQFGGLPAEAGQLPFDRGA
jgi:hypothetical protein